MKPIVKAALAAISLAFASSASAQDALKIGVLVPLTGPQSPDGTRLLKGHELAIKHINEQGGLAGLRGAKAELVVGDTQSRPEIARSEAERVISRDGVHVLLGAWATAATLPAAQVAERSKVPFIIPNAFVDSLTEQGMRYVFRVTAKSSQQTSDLTKFAEYLKSKGVPAERIAIVYEDGPYGQSALSIAKAALQQRSIDFVAEESFKSGAADVGTQIAKLKASEADLVMIASFAQDAVLILRSMAAQSYKPVILGISGGYMHPLVTDLGALSEHTFATTDWMPDMQNEASANFVKAYEAEYGETPTTSAALTYIATWVAALAADEAKSLDTTAIRDAMASLDIKDGPAAMLTSGIKFDEAGQNQVVNVGAEKIDGKFVTVWPEEVASQSVTIPNAN